MIIYYIQQEEKENTGNALLKKMKTKVGVKSKDENESEVPKLNLIKKTETFECYETEEIVNAFKACRNKVCGVGSLPEFQGHKF